MTPIQTVYDAFLARVEENRWANMDDLDLARQDWRALLSMSIAAFRFPRISLEIEGDQFINSLTNAEIQVLAILMKHEWVKRCAASWEHLRMLYTNKDFSQKYNLSALKDYEQTVRWEAHFAQEYYERAINGKPYDYTQLAGD